MVFKLTHERQMLVVGFLVARNVNTREVKMYYRREMKNKEQQ